MEAAWSVGSPCSEKYQECCDKAPLFHPEKLYVCEDVNFEYRYNEGETNKKHAFIKLSSILPPGNIHGIVIDKDDVKKMKNIQLLIGGQLVIQVSEGILRAKEGCDINIIKPFCDYLFGPDAYKYHELCLRIEFYSEHIATSSTGEERIFKYDNYDHDCDIYGGYTESAFDIVKVEKYRLPSFKLKCSLREDGSQKTMHISQLSNSIRLVQTIGTDIYRVHDAGMFCQIVVIPTHIEESIVLKTGSFQCEFKGNSMYTLELPKQKVRIEYMDFHITNCKDVLIVHQNRLQCSNEMCGLCFSL
jgi:hypothetical protein